MSARWDPEGKSILVTGATGFIGRAVAQRLAAEGHRVLGLARTEEAATVLRSRGHTPVLGDIADVATIEAVAREVDGLVHTATTNDARNAPLDRGVARAVIRAFEGTQKPFVYTSGVWVLGDTGARIADEGSPVAPLDVVAHRGPLEAEVQMSAERGVRAIVLRPGIAYGHGGGIPSMLAAEARAKGGVRVVGDGRQEWPTVHVDDLADLYARALGSAEAGSILHGVASQARVRDLATAASLGVAGRARLLPWSAKEARAELGAFGEFFALHQRVSSERTRASLGWAPSAPSPVEEFLVGSYAKPLVAAAPVVA